MTERSPRTFRISDYEHEGDVAPAVDFVTDLGFEVTDSGTDTDEDGDFGFVVVLCTKQEAADLRDRI